MLSNIEVQLQLRERLECVNPSLKPFFCGKKAAIVLAGIAAITKLISHEKSNNTVTLADEFDRMLEQEGLTKLISLYKERQFTKLGYSAASVLQALPQIAKLLMETWKSNLLIEACKLYVNCELFITEVHSYLTVSENIKKLLIECVLKKLKVLVMELVSFLHVKLHNFINCNPRN